MANQKVKITELPAGTPIDTDVIPFVDLTSGETKKGLKSDLKGDKGDAGNDATVDVGTTSTLSAGSPATVVNSGTTSDAVFDFGIPQGIQGVQGPAGADGVVQTIVAGTNVTVDSTDPANPIVNATASPAPVDSVNGQTGVVVLDTDDISEGTKKYTTAADISKLAGIEAGAEVNDVDLTNTVTLTNKRITPRVGTVASSATPTINTDNVDAYSITALTTNITSFTTNLSGTPTNFQKLIIRIKDNGTARTIAWGASFEAKGVDLPTTTVASKVLTIGFIYDNVTSKWGCVASVTEA